MKIRRANVSDAGGIAKVHVDSWRTTYKGIVSNTILDQLSYEDRKKRWERGLSDSKSSTNTYVVENETGNIVGFANGGPERTEKYGFDGELYAIYILQEYQRQQLGKQLFSYVARDLHKQGHQSVFVWVLTENPSRRFYQSFQPVEIDRQILQIGGGHHEEIAYGWKDIEFLLNQLTAK
jgi:N-acetylglutamate synthase-like GNAT family acetyltransferase